MLDQGSRFRDGCPAKGQTERHGEKAMHTQRLDSYTRRPRNTKDCRQVAKARGDAGDRFSVRPPEVTNTDGTLLLDFWPPSLCDNTFPVSKIPGFRVIS